MADDPTAQQSGSGDATPAVSSPGQSGDAEVKAPQFDLSAALSALNNDTTALIHQLQKDEQRLNELRQSVVKDSKRNFSLERDLMEIDDKIKLLVKNRITVQEAMSSLSSGGDAKDNEQSPLQNKRDVYEDLFYILQSKPRYFAKLARVVDTVDIPMFVQTVVFDMYGDQYDTREERLLLSCFKKVLQAELKHAQSRGSLLRANTAITQMLSAYARRGQGLSILKDILEQPLRDITGRRDLNLEIDPMKVYLQVVQDYETKTGEKSPLPTNIDGDTAAQNPEVQALVAERQQELVRLAELILNRICEGAHKIPYGMRWICKQLGELCKARFPDSDRYQLGSLMGGYIYLRFFNPVIVTPDTVNFVKNKPTRIMRRNLILIAKVLQNLSNGLLFGDKERYMRVLNPFLESKKDQLMDYFDRLIMVDDLGDSLQVDKYLEHTKQTTNTISISFNQIFLIHRLLKQHVDVVAKTNDSIKPLLEQLGDAPEKVARSKNRTVILQLQDRRTSRLSTAADAFAATENKANPLYVQAKTLLLSVLKLLPTTSTCKSLNTFLEEQKTVALAQQENNLADHISNVMAMLHTLAGMGLIKPRETVDDTFNFFLWEIALEAMSRKERMAVVSKRLVLVQNALTAIQGHHDYLGERLEMYRLYLENVRKGSAGMAATAAKKGKTKKDKKKKKPKTLQHKIPHPELVSSGIIMSVDPNIPTSVLKKCYYLFKMDEPGVFQITLHLKKGFDMKLVKKPIIIRLEDLLTMQDHRETRYPLEYIDLNVNLLVHMLNKEFMAKI